MKMKSFIVIIIIIVTFISCNTTEPEKPKLEITKEDASCTEAWIKVTGETGSEVILNRDNKEVQKFTLASSPQIVYDDSLLPNNTYTYQAIKDEEVSNKISVTTLDTTSHNFSFQTFYLGGASSSSLSDVAIVNDTLAYAVGEIYKYDSTGQIDQHPYSLVKWDGRKWSLKKLYYKDKDYQGNEFTSVLSNIRGILALSTTDIWFAAGSIFHWNGRDTIADFSYRTLTPTGLLPGINKLWGTSSIDLYGVGNSGAIVHYTNGSWQKIESGTDLNFYDLWGSINPQSGQSEILTVASDVGTAKGSIIVKISNDNASPISSNGITGNATAVWIISNRAYYIASGALYYKHNLTDSLWNSLTGLTQYAVTSIYGNDINDVFFTSSGGDIVHFNGISFRGYLDEIGMPQIVYSSIKSKSNLIIAVGFLGARAVITIGKRQN